MAISTATLTTTVSEKVTLNGITYCNTIEYDLLSVVFRFTMYCKYFVYIQRTGVPKVRWSYQEYTLDLNPLLYIPKSFLPFVLLFLYLTLYCKTSLIRKENSCEELHCSK